MYTKYYGLARKPFALTPDPTVVFMSETHQEGLAILKYGILSKKCFLVLTADVGTLSHRRTRNVRPTITVGGAQVVEEP